MTTDQQYSRCNVRRLRTRPLHRHIMPSLCSNTLPRQMPLTPPEYYNLASGSARGDRQLPALHLTTRTVYTPNHEIGSSKSQDFLEQYSHHSQARSAWPSSMETSLHAPLSYQGPCQVFSNAYGVAIAPLIPPMRVPSHTTDDHQQRAPSKRASTQGQPKEEKVMGGVAAHLDYEMEAMVDFVSETAQGMYEIYASGICLADIDISRSVLDSKGPVHSDFHKYVSQVLSSTRLPSSTILLGLQYLAVRMTLLSNEGNYKYGNGLVHRMLTIALLLGSKFLDDNTFQNRSWSEVSSIPIGDINVLEVEWLAAIEWTMHVDINDPNGFLRWHQHWQRFQVSKANRIRMVSSVQSLKHTHIDDVKVGRQRSMHQRSSPTTLHRASYIERPISDGLKASSQSQWSTAQYDCFPNLRSHMDYSPPSAPETGPNTPEWFGLQNQVGYGHESQQNYPALKMPAPLQVVGTNALQSDFHTPYAQQFNPHGHGNNCACSYCSPQHDRFFMASGYGLQPVVG